MTDPTPTPLLPEALALLTTVRQWRYGQTTPEELVAAHDRWEAASRTAPDPVDQDGAANRPRIDAERRTPLDAGTDSSEPSTGLSGGGGREADAPPTVADLLQGEPGHG